eukprot:COSAG05_NODE_137_length_16843_cov_121.090779_4_plen_68_part_00
MAHLSTNIRAYFAAVAALLLLLLLSPGSDREEHWTANNVMAMGLAVTGIELINLGSFQVSSKPAARA